MGAGLLTTELPLPSGFRVEDVLSFHRRDPQQVAERVDSADGEARLHKAFLWQQEALAIDVDFGGGRIAARCMIEGGGPNSTGNRFDQAGFNELLRHMLGLDQQVALFEQAHRDHPQLGWLIRRNAGLRVPQAATPFEAISWAILGQQISLVAAIALRRRLIEAVGRRHRCGLLCYPDAASVLAVDAPSLRALGCPQSKVAALHGLAEAVLSGELPLQRWREAEMNESAADEISAGLLKIRGIGPWTVNYALLRGFGWLDGSLDGDVAVRRGLQRLLSLEQVPSALETRLWLEAFTPWRALVAAHLWTLKSDDRTAMKASSSGQGMQP